MWSRHIPRMSLGCHARRQRLGSGVSLLVSRVSRPTTCHHTAASHQNPTDLMRTTAHGALLHTARCARRTAHCRALLRTARCALRTARCALRTALCTAQARRRTPTTVTNTALHTVTACITYGYRHSGEPQQPRHQHPIRFHPALPTVPALHYIRLQAQRRTPTTASSTSR